MSVNLALVFSDNHTTHGEYKLEGLLPLEIRPHLRLGISSSSRVRKSRQQTAEVPGPAAEEGCRVGYAG